MIQWCSLLNSTGSLPCLGWKVAPPRSYDWSCLDSLGRQENSVLMMRYIFPFLHPLASDSPLPSTDMGMILRCIDILLVIALSTKVSITLFRLPQPHSTTVLARCGWCTLGYLSFLSMSGISHEWLSATVENAVRVASLSTPMASGPGALKSASSISW